MEKKMYGQEPLTGAAAEYFTSQGLRVPTVEEAAHAENAMRKDRIFTPGTSMFEGVLLTHLVTVVDPGYGLHDGQEGVRGVPPLHMQ